MSQPSTVAPTPAHAVGAGPADPAEQLQWLVDRASISDLLVEFARSLDDRDWDTHVELYLPDGTLDAAGVVHLAGHDQLRATGSERGLGRYSGTWHLSSNHAISIDGDTARTRSYLIGVHLLDNDLTHHADGGGWYDCTLRRTPEGWRFASVVLSEKWRNDQAMAHIEDDPV